MCQSALVTGGGSGIGQAVVEALSRRGVRVFVGDVDKERAEAVARAVGERAEPVFVDVSQSATVTAAFAFLRTQLLRLDLLVNCAAVLGRVASVEEADDQQWDKVLQVNLAGTFYCCREAVKWMKETGGGRIINFASVAAFMPVPGAAAYGVSKAGVVQLTKTLAREVAPYNIRVNAIAPGYVETPMLDELDPAFREQVLRRTPLGRFAKPQEIAAVVVFLASPEADFFTGQVLSPNGGLVMWP